MAANPALPASIAAELRDLALRLGRIERSSVIGVSGIAVSPTGLVQFVSDTDGIPPATVAGDDGGAAGVSLRLHAEVPVPVPPAAPDADVPPPPPPSETTLEIQPGQVVGDYSSGDWALKANTLRNGNVAFEAFQSGSDAATAEWRAVNPDSLVYIPIRAASFPAGSSREVKEDITDLPFDALAAVRAAVAQSWRYRPDYAADGMTHISPLAEDLPPQLVTDVDGVGTVDLLSLIGTLWAALSQLAARVDALSPSPSQEAPSDTA